MKNILRNEIADPAVRARNIEALRDSGVILPKFSELTHPSTIPASIREELESVDRDAAHPLNLFRVHWYNQERSHGLAHVPEHIVLPPALTGVDAKILVLLGNRFPMIHAHKVLAAYACLVPGIVTGTFNIRRHRAVWPSTGNYCRGGVAISRIIGARGVAVLPAGMSRERFDWLEKWVTDPSDIIRTPGTESNVKEIYDACAELERDRDNVIFNQFSEYPNYLVHMRCTGSAVARVFEEMRSEDHRLRLHAFVSATGSAGTIAAGDSLKEKYGSVTVAVEALECPTLLSNGFGEHNIQGIGDKHIPLIHNVMNTDMIVGVSDRATDSMNVLFNSVAGREQLARRYGVPQGVIDQFHSLGISSLCNIVGAIKTAKYYRLGVNDVVATVATDGAAMYETEYEKTLAAKFNNHFDDVDAAEVYGQYVLGAATDNVVELTFRDRERIFNLGYFTWVEQQGLSIDDFTARRKQSFWDGLADYIDSWDAMIEEVNAEACAVTV